MRCLHALAALDLLQRGADPTLAATLDGWCEEILSSRSGAMLTNLPGEQGQPHLWGHVQEAVLVDAAPVLGREDLQEVAVESAEAVFADVIRSGFELPLVCAYDVQSAVFVMDCARTSVIGTASSLASTLTSADFPKPGGPHKQTSSRRFFSAKLAETAISRAFVTWRWPMTCRKLLG